MGVGPYLHEFLRVRRMASEGSATDWRSSLLIVRTDRIVTTEVVAPDARMSQQIVGFIDSAVNSLSHACCSCITAGTDYVSTLFRGAGVLWLP